LTEPPFEAGNGLVQKHAQTIDRGAARGPRLGQKAGFERVVDKVGDGLAGMQSIERIIATTPDALGRIEEIVHPLIAKDRQVFLDEHAKDPIVLLDVPLLFEAGLDAICDVTVTVSTDPDTQRSRVLMRPGMTEEQFALMLTRQLPDAVKRARADHVIDSSTLEGARSAVQTLVSELRKRQADA
jgi:dephospho-CoA kinase